MVGHLKLTLLASLCTEMDELKHRAGEKLEALHVAAVTVAGNSKSRVQDVYNQTSEAWLKLRDAFSELWNNELIAEGRERIVAWTRDAVQRIKEGAPPLSPVVLYEELLALFHDRVWRRSMVIFACGVAVGGGLGLAAGLRAATRGASGPASRALHSHDDSVILVDDACAPSAGTGEVLVRVQAFSVCSLDRRTLRGRARALRALITGSHVTVGRGFAGVVLDVGHGVSDLELGDEVWGVVSEWSGGAACELLTVRSTRVAKRPRGVAAERAAALPWAGAVALAALEYLQLSPATGKGKRIAICGASSGEGCVALQLLAAWGARLTAAAPRHLALALQNLGAHEYVDVESGGEWAALEARAAHAGPWDAALTCSTALIPAGCRCNNNAILRATAPRWSHLDLRPTPLITDRLPTPLYVAFAAAFYTYRLLRCLLGCGTDTDWLQDAHTLRDGLTALTLLVEQGQLAPVLDKVYLPQDFESALAHACSEDALGTTVVRFP